jgi:hypothetical protein
MVQAQPRTGPRITWPPLPDDFYKLVDDPVENVQQPPLAAALGAADANWLERQKAETERQRAERLATLLREQGIDPDQVP